jgi:two-component system response regulator YesN
MQGTIEPTAAQPAQSAYPSAKVEELRQIISSITLRLNRSQEAEERIRCQLRLNLPVLRSELLLSILSGEIKAGETLRDKLDMYELSFSFGEGCRMLLIETDPTLEIHTAADRGLLEYAIKNIAEEMLNTRYHCWSATSRQRLIVFLIKEREDGREDDADSGSFGIRQMLEQLRQHVRRYLKLDLTLYVSEKVPFPNSIEDTYHRGRTQIYRRSEKIDAIADELERSGSCTRMLLREAHMHLLSGFVSMARASGRVLDDVIGVQAADPSLPIRTAEQLRAWSRSALERIVQIDPPSIQEDTHGLVVGQVKKYVREQIGNDLALQVIAEKIYWHPSYLSKIFKEKTGINLSTYILQQRIELAKSLLTDSSLHIYEIAERVGYQSAQSFIREFKKYSGVTPKSFRVQRAALTT